MSSFVQRALAPIVASLVCVAACSPSAEPAVDASRDAAAPDVTTDVAQDGPLIDHEAWVAMEDADDDPFADRPADIDCERGVGWDVELLDTDVTVGIDTADCNYFSVAQPALRAIPPGESVLVRLWHFELVGDGDAHAAVAIDGDIVWERTIAIPRPSELIVDEFVLASGAPRDAQIVFHLHNHGLNSWNLAEISVVPR